MQTPPACSISPESLFAAAPRPSRLACRRRQAKGGPLFLGSITKSHLEKILPRISPTGHLILLRLLCFLAASPPFLARTVPNPSEVIRSVPSLRLFFILPVPHSALGIPVRTRNGNCQGTAKYAKPPLESRAAFISKCSSSPQNRRSQIPGFGFQPSDFRGHTSHWVGHGSLIATDTNTPPF